ncbi:hypothetical protein Slala02_54470 [Streptomyces lavendulae subsp. lavendulae]|nr:hypothetical protein Slala01_07640 [Streptomyces lavendulae subsp. lavendulae]GLX29627.1 hypothetical protein Slala02_54470 [Streptomyces lavendulae subsp. lavendulae]
MPEQVLDGALADARAARELVCPVRDLIGRRREVARAGRDGEPDVLPLGGGEAEEGLGALLDALHAVARVRMPPLHPARWFGPWIPRPGLGAGGPGRDAG